MFIKAHISQCFMLVRFACCRYLFEEGRQQMVCQGLEKPLILISKASYFTSGYFQLMGIMQLRAVLSPTQWRGSKNQWHHGCQRVVE